MAARTPAPSKYIGPEPKADIDALRRSVPDDPIKLPRGFLACEGCGVAHDGPAILSVPLGESGRFSAEFTRCPDCTRLNDLAMNDERTRTSLYALAVVSVPAPENPAPWVPWMSTIGGLVAWLGPGIPKRDWCNPYPWAHVGLTHRTKIKEAYLLAVRNRVHQSAEPIHLTPPWGIACLFCGVGSVPLAPLEVARRGGRENATRTVWRGVTAQAKAFGAKGRDLLEGFVCPTCAEAVEASPSISRACARAFEEHAEREGIRVPSNLFDLYVDKHPFVMPGWVSLGKNTPNAKPWEHVVLFEEDEPQSEFVAST